MDLCVTPEHSCEALVNILSFPYTGGSTNTAAALETILDMFTEENGDRPDVPNYAVIITDGESDNRMQTFVRAVAAR